MPRSTQNSYSMRTSEYARRIQDFMHDTRNAMGLSQDKFGWEIARRVGMEQVGQGVVSAWELGEHTIPGPILACVIEMAIGEGLMLRDAKEVSWKVG